MKPTIRSVKGTRDFYPKQMAIRNWIYDKVRGVSESFGYQEFESPFLETLELYAAKSGDELVKKQSFAFPDRSGEMITLRPELTPSLARMVAQRQNQLIFPLRWWSWGPFWRYERPQKGRSREFFQWNIDLIGVETPEADAEMVAIAASFLKECGLSDEEIIVYVNNRKLIDTELVALGISLEKRTDVFHLIDRRDKLSHEKWNAYANDMELTSSQIDGLNLVLSNDQLWQKSDDMARFFAVIDSLGIGKYVRFAPHIIRGLDYYTGTVFEVWDKSGEFRAILGGGRYDDLVSDVGGDPLPAVGFAMGDMVINLVLDKFDCIPADLGRSPALILVTVFDESSFSASYALATQLRDSGLNVACYPEAVKLGKQFKYADRIGARFVLILGPDERSSGMVAIKDLHSGDQQSVELSKAAQTLMRLLDDSTPS